MAVTASSRTGPLGAGIIGCGIIAQSYARDLARYPEIELRAVTDVDVDRAEALAARYGARVHPDLDALLADESVDIAVNLTPHHAHTEVVRRCLAAGKHVHSEKPLALTHREAQELVSLARDRGLRLGCSPTVFLGDAQQTAMKLVRDGRLGPVRVVYAEANWGRIERWHSAPQPFYEVGPMVDVGVYPLTMVTAMFGPVRRVNAYGRVAMPHRFTTGGVSFPVTTPDFVTAIVELDTCVMRLTTNFYVGQHSTQKGMEFHGDQGSLHLENWSRFGASVRLSTDGDPYTDVPLLRPAPDAGPPAGPDFGRGVADLARGILTGAPHRATGEHAAHVVEVLTAVQSSMEKESPVTVTSSVTPPAPMEWAR